MSSTPPRHQNRLVDETSPYLLQHAHNPVDWYPWGEEALARARAEDKPILLSIGYAACHWCHVMERESFENEDTAHLMNEHFVCIKVDREERPDLDEIYMAATVAMSGSGGWPMTVFLTPGDHRPFFAGTYFPPVDKFGRPGFPTLLRRLAELWKSERSVLDTQAQELERELVAEAQAASVANVAESAIDAAVAQLARAFDPTHGGFGSAPKFPPSMALELLLRHHRRTGDERSLVMVRRTLDGMARGGMYDQLGGGFARYATDDAWLVPHFEKMLYDNALLARVYVHAWQVAKNPEDERVVRETLDYVLRELTSEEGAFYSATDADSEGVEGKFFVWTPEEVEAVLPAREARVFCAYYDVTPQGNWEGHSILHLPRPASEVAAELGIAEDELARDVAKAREKLYAARRDRVPPLTDDKILTAWNALMIGALAEAGRILAEPRYTAAAARAADFLLATMRRPDGGLFRTSRAGKTHLDAYLEDYAYLCDALIDVYESGRGARYLEAARGLAERMLTDFHDAETGGFFTTAHQHEALLVRMRQGQDGAIPSANAIAATALTRLSWHLGRSAWAELAREAVRAHGKLIERAPRAFASSLCVADMLLEGPVEAVLVGDAQPLADALARRYLPNRVIVFHRPGEPTLAPAELVAGKEPMSGRPALYVCRGFTCKRPVTEVAEVASVLEDEQRVGLARRGRRLGQRLAGRATPEGTRRSCERHALGEHAYVTLGRTDLSVARIGFGGYRVSDGVPAFEAALTAALRGGVNLVDTSTNYTDGGSERLVGSVVLALAGQGAVARDEIVVVSKIGYVQAQNLALARQRVSEGRGFEEMVEYEPSCWHCIHPTFLDDQLERSLDRLGLDTLDVVLLHNPEYFFSDALKRGGVDEATRSTFYERVERAFAFFEAEVRRGRIGCYGVSSNTVAHDPDADPEATELPRLLEAARRAGGEDHHFRVLQLPLNLVESDGVLDKRVGEATVLEHAASVGLGVLANRPLNAITATGMLRLAAAPEPDSAPRPFGDALRELAALERRFADTLGELVSGENPFVLAGELATLDGKIGGRDQFEHIARAQVLPHVRAAIARVERGLGRDRHAWSEWRSAYIAALEKALAALEAQTLARVHAQAVAFAEMIDPLLPLARQSEPLQHKALLTLVSTPHLSVTLLGMRRPSYVDDALAVLRLSPMDRPRRIYEAVREALGSD